MPNLHSSDTHFEIGKAIQLTPERENYDVAFIATGETVAPAYLASQALLETGHHLLRFEFAQHSSL